MLDDIILIYLNYAIRSIKPYVTVAAPTGMRTIRESRSGRRSCGFVHNLEAKWQLYNLPPSSLPTLYISKALEL
jgi:hypothetical protein